MNRVKEVIELCQGGELKAPSQVRKERTRHMLEYLYELEYFTRQDVQEAFKREAPDLSQSSFKYTLQKLLKERKIERIGWNKYCIAGKKKAEYQHTYTGLAREIAMKMVENFAYVEFRIFEPVQVSEIIHDGYDSKVIFISIEPEYLDAAAEILDANYPGMVLKKPDEEVFNGKIIYEQADGWIVLRGLISESPRGRGRMWHTDIEKLLADIINDKILRSLWSDKQIAKLYETAFDEYNIDESRMLRYARRRKGVEKIEEFIKENTDIRLRTI